MSLLRFELEYNRVYISIAGFCQSQVGGFIFWFLDSAILIQASSSNSSSSRTNSSLLSQSYSDYLKMPTGTCFCGKTGVTYQGEPVVKVRLAISHRSSHSKNAIEINGASFPGLKVIKAGILDDPALINEAAKPGAELYAGQRVPWAAKVEGTEDKEAMP